VAQDSHTWVVGHRPTCTSPWWGWTPK